MDKSIYQSPQSDVADAVKRKVDVPEAILKKIRNGWIMAVVSGVLTFALMLVAINTGTMGDIFDIWTSLDVLLIFGLAFGIYKKSRIAASCMFVYFLVSKILIMYESGNANGWMLSLVFLYIYFHAMLGTYQYHKFIKSPQGQAE